MGKKVLVEKPAEVWLEALRQGTAKFNFCKKELFASLIRTGQTLTDIGSNQAELDELQQQNPRKVGVSYAKFWLGKLRTTHKGNAQVLGLLTGLMREHQISMSEIDATDADFQ